MAKPFDSQKFKGGTFEVREDPTERGLLHRKGPTEVDSSGLSEGRVLGDVAGGTTLEILSHFEKFLDDMKGVIDRRRNIEASKRRAELREARTVVSSIVNA